MQRDLIYFSTEPIQNFVISMGIDAADFVTGVSPVPRNLILLNDDVAHANGSNLHTKFSVVRGASAVKAYFLNSKVRTRQCVDFTAIEDLDELMGREVADLLYLGHMKFPLNGAFSSKLQNQYVYLTLRSRFLKVYYRNFDNFGAVLNASVKRHLTAVIHRKRIRFNPTDVLRWGRSRPLVRDLPNPLIKSLALNATRGVVLAFDRASVRHHRRVFLVPVLVERISGPQSNWSNESDLYTSTTSIGQLRYDLPGHRWQFRTRVKD